MAGGATGDSRELDQTPTWAVASVCAVIILISLALEKMLHRIGEWFTEKRKKALFEALEKVKAELMILGFISLLLTIGQNYIAKICISEKVADTMLPCKLKHNDKVETKGGENHRRLLWDLINSNRRVLAAASGNSCKQGKVPFVSTNGIHQLHIFIFFLAVFHVVYSALTMALGRAKIRRWKEWEKETSSLDYEFSNDPSRFRFAHETSFVRQHTSFWDRISILLYIVSFFRQFVWSVRKADYLTMRHGFISAHLAPGSKFDFQKYIKRSLEDDFKVVITLAVGTKLQAIITKMALEIKERHVVVQGMPVVQLSDHHFWFGRPVQDFSHGTSPPVPEDVWIKETTKKTLVDFFPILRHSATHEVHTSINIEQSTNNFSLVQILTLSHECIPNNLFRVDMAGPFAPSRKGCLLPVRPVQEGMSMPPKGLFTLFRRDIQEMGAHMKRSIFDEQTSKALKKWHQAAKKRHGKSSHQTARTPGESPSASPSASPAHPLQRFMTTGHATNAPSKTKVRYLSENELSDTDQDMPSTSPSTPILGRGASRSDQEPRLAEHRLQIKDHRNPEDDFSFTKPAPT
ncbi:hypothetical protein Taro_043182 [Colocasia esculenta]|uniref:MLO-like protein n=1 Tax=Colocasia esculenta TaxID=4460 RepID=A0A843X3Q7_COLES|nr:hypothetical protein [Colocasia esculenta]